VQGLCLELVVTAGMVLGVLFRNAAVQRRLTSELARRGIG
jgi:hypothetical protein